MRRFISVVLSAAVVSLCALTGCGANETSGADCSFDYAMVGHPESLDPQIASDKCSLTIIGNLYSGLFETSEDGGLKNACAESYSVSEDGLTYNFKIRKNCYWFRDKDKDDEVEKGEYYRVTAHDFEFAFRRLFDPATQSPHRETYACIKNAQDIISGQKDFTEIGVAALSDDELCIQLERKNTDFLYLLTLTPAMPCSEDFFYSTKGRYGLDDQSIISNGAFFVRQWFYDKYGHDNFVYMQRNLANSDYDMIYPTAVNFYMKDSRSEAENSFEDGDSDVLLSFSCTSKQKEEYNVKKYDNYTLGLIINPKDSKYGNLNIRKALAYGIDRNSFKDSISEDLKTACGIISPGITVEGKKYRNEVNDEEVYTDSEGSRVTYNADLAVKCYKDGMSEMGIESLDNVKLLVPKDLLDTQYLHLVTQNWQTLFGFYIGIEEVDAQEFNSRIQGGDYTLAMYPLTGSCNSPLSFMEKFTSGQKEFNYTNPDIDAAVKEAAQNGSNSMEQYKKTEQKILGDFFFIPVFYKSEYELMGTGNEDILYDPFTKQLFFRYAKYFA